MCQKPFPPALQPTRGWVGGIPLSANSESMYCLYRLVLLINYFLIYYYLIVIWPDVRLLENRLSNTILGVIKQGLRDYTTLGI